MPRPLLEIDIRLEGNLLNQRILQQAVERGRRTGLLRAGAYVRRQARKSIKRSRRLYSRPGEVPISHTGMIKRILYAYDRDTNTVVVGPIPARLETLKLLEFGGRGPFKQRLRNGRTVIRQGNFQARPFMRPALARTVADGLIQQAFEKSIRSATFGVGALGGRIGG